MKIEECTMVPTAIEQAFRDLNGAGPLGLSFKASGQRRLENQNS
jgi:hypothetical protein